jgi:16S rRNA (guanine1207-N2)-methyltransferase
MGDAGFREETYYEGTISSDKGVVGMSTRKRFSDDPRGTPRLKTDVEEMKEARMYSGSTDRVITKIDKEKPEIGLLLRQLEVKPGEVIIDFCSQAGLMGTAIALNYKDNRLFVVDSNLENITLADRNLEANNLTNADVIPGVGLETLEAKGISPDIIVYSPPRFLNAEAVVEQIKISKAVLKKGGRLYLVTHKKGGAETYITAATETFGEGSTEILDRGGGGYRIARSVKSDEEVPVNETSQSKTLEFNVLGEHFEIQTLPSLFSQEGLDDGTRLLLENVNLESFGRMMDLGCGWGAIGIVASRLNLQGRVTMVDIDLRATYSAERNVANLGLGNRINVVATEDINTLSERFDLVLSNPPFHEDYPTLVNMFHGVRNVLAKGGSKRGEVCIVVGNKYLEKFKDVLTETFGKVEQVVVNDRYTVLRSYK